MDKLELSTLRAMCRQLAARPWPDSELAELVAPSLGIITGFDELLRQLEALGKLDLDTLAPAQGVQRRSAGW